MLRTVYAAGSKAEGMKDRGTLQEDAGWMEIWIVVNPLKDQENTLRTYSVRDDLTGERLIERDHSDLVVFYLGEEGGAGSESLQVLDLLFRTPDSPERTTALQRLNIDAEIV